jgi:WD40 repeat protein
VHSVAFSPDSQRILLGYKSGRFELREIAAGRCVQRFSMRDGFHSSMFLPDGLHVLTWSQHICILWDASTGAAIRRFDLDDYCAPSPDGRFLLSGTRAEASTMLLWDVRTGALHRRIQGSPSIFGGAPIAFSPSAQSVLMGVYQQTGYEYWLLDVSSLRCIQKFPNNRYTCSAISSNGRFILFGSLDNTVELWEIATGRELHAFAGHSEHVRSVAFSPDGQYALSAGYKDVKLWHVSRFYPTAHGRGPQAQPLSSQAAMNGASSQPQASPERPSWWRRTFG